MSALTSQPSLALVLPEEVVDPVALDARLKALRAECEKNKTFSAPPNATPAEIAALRASHSARVSEMIREQIDIIAKLRRTATGPAKKGGKRAKAAPPDLSSLLTD